MTWPIPAVIPTRLRGLEKHKDYDASSKTQSLTGFWAVYPSCLKVRHNRGKLTSVKLISWYDDIARAQAKSKDFATPNRFDFTGEVLHINNRGRVAFFVLRIWRNLEHNPAELAKAGKIEYREEASHFDQHITGRIPRTDKGKVLKVVCRFNPKDGSVYLKSKEEVPCEVPLVEIKSQEQLEKERQEAEAARQREEAAKRPPVPKPIIKKKPTAASAPTPPAEAPVEEAIAEPAPAEPPAPPPPPSKPLSVQVGKQLFQARESIRIADGKLWIDGTHTADAAMVLVEEVPGSTVQIEAAVQERLEMPEGPAVLMLRG